MGTQISLCIVYRGIEEEPKLAIFPNGVAGGGTFGA